MKFESKLGVKAVGPNVSASQACDTQDAFDVAEAGEDAREVVDLFDFEREPHAGFQVAGLGLHGGNVEFVAGERVGYVAQKP